MSDDTPGVDDAPVVEEVALPANLQESLVEKFPYLEQVHYRLLTSLEEVKEYLSGIKSKHPLVLDLETSGLNHRKHRIVGVALTYATQEGVYIPIAHTVRPELNLPWEPVRDLIMGILKDKQRSCVVFNRKFEGNFLEAAGMDINSIEWDDCLVAVYVRDPNEGGQLLKLKRQTKINYGIDQVDFEDMFPDVPKSERNFAAVDPEAAYLYACGDVDFTLRLWKDTALARKQMPFVYSKMENPLTDVIRRMENNGVKLDVPYYRRVQAELEMRIHIVAERIYKVTGRKILKKRTRTMVKRDPDTNKPIKGPDGKSVKHKVVDFIEGDFDLASPPQVAKKLFGPEEEGGLGIENPHRTETGKVATSEDVVASLAPDNEVISDVLLWRKLTKCLSTYILHLINDCDEGQIGYFSFMQCAAPTGRMASSKGGYDSGSVGMNVQSTPKAVPEEVKNAWIIEEWVDKPEEGQYPCLNAWPTQYLDPNPDWICLRKECQCIKEGKAKGHQAEGKTRYWEIPNVRKGFIGRPGTVIVAIDYSGIEQRVAANISGEPAWINAFLQPDPDLHMDTARVVYKKENPSKVERDNAKTVNYTLLFGGSGGTVASRIEGMSKQEGLRLVDQYFKALPTLHNWIEGLHTQGRETMQVETWFRRRRPLHMYKDNNSHTRHKSAAYGDRSTVSTVVQGTAADIMKIALLRLDASIQKRGWGEYVKMLLTVHDECVFEIRADKIEEVLPVLVEAMAFPVKGWPVPMVCDIEIGPSWGEVKEHRLVDGQLILHSELSKAIKEGTPVEKEAIPSWVKDSGPSPEELNLRTGPAPDPTASVTLQFRSVRSKHNLMKLREILEEAPGETPLVILFAGASGRHAIEEGVDVVRLVQLAGEAGLSVTVGS